MRNPAPPTRTAPLSALVLLTPLLAQAQAQGVVLERPGRSYWLVVAIIVAVLALAYAMMRRTTHGI